MTSYEDSLEKLIRAIDKVYLNPRQLFIRSFLSGLFTGLGATVGLTLVLILVGWIFTLLGGLPLVGFWIKSLDQILIDK
ncbi:MAG: hypothetical protein A3F33_00075 [Candidatus Woykebacteria bacterium RIFCSPHIGHO2_12_FULL_43_10]|uniref:Uncharacterized protein n=2 Tax=Candidatus Woykeibacteriota TaxID=1817899 RepID=A0A1G1WWM2_9BACT|nr:MAG: hypothetical protein A3F33_00075 [Candidatus Woykebacteria bacterium RIFCSPHIGHO2_12_FULL_43_10]OGY30263.1 MAG: hypothetical protein A3J50_04340 [Candidatus Woykebacteria bacterium RIFCSPHIGHO2_02_FULL_43_16b]OGY32103.1 MAG: hypothetical protein A3A61_00280 [Candidatus Woykebacteria bacterium RIFCSPLOWO2_01_FULL_43_14]